MIMRLPALLALLAALIIPAAAQPREERGGPMGRFDFYVLSLSWSATFCDLTGRQRRNEQCEPGRNPGFVVHGLWPQFERARQKLHPYVEKYGEWGVAVFIGVPLPGTGAYSGAVGSYLLGLDKRRLAVANLAGVLIAGAAVTGVCLLVDHGLVGADSWVRRLFTKTF